MRDCEYNREQLSAWLDNELDEQAREEVRAHLDGCTACGAYLRKLEALRQALAQLEEAPPPALHDAIMRRLRREKHGGKIIQFSRRYPFAAVAAMLALVLSLSYAAGRLPLAAGSGAAPQSFNMAMAGGAESTAAATAAAADGEREMGGEANDYSLRSKTSCEGPAPLMMAPPAAGRGDMATTAQTQSANLEMQQELPLMPLPYTRSFRCIAVARLDAPLEIPEGLSFQRQTGVEYRGGTVELYFFIVGHTQREALAGVLENAAIAFYKTPAESELIDPAAQEGLLVLVVPAAVDSATAKGQ